MIAKSYCQSRYSERFSPRRIAENSGTYIDVCVTRGEQERKSCSMGTNGDRDRNLVFEHELDPGQDDDSRPISGMEAIENRIHREGGQSDDLNGGDQEIGRHDDDIKRDEAKARHAERGAQERKPLLSLAQQVPGSAVVDARGK